MIFYTLVSVIISFLGLPVFGQQLGDFVYSTSPRVEYTGPQYLGYNVYLVQVQIADRLISGSIPFVQNDSLVLLDSIKSLSSYPLITSMRNSPDRIKIFDDYIYALKSILYVVNSSQREIKSEISSLSSQIASCSKEKQLYDKQYLDALRDSSSVETLESLLSLSQNSASCISTKETILTAKQSLSDLLASEIHPLIEKYNYLLDNREIIINYFDLLDANYLQKIIDVQKKIKKY